MTNITGLPKIRATFGQRLQGSLSVTANDRRFVIEIGFAGARAQHRLTLLGGGFRVLDISTLETDPALIIGELSAEHDEGHIIITTGSYTDRYQTLIEIAVKVGGEPHSAS